MKDTPLPLVVSAMMTDGLPVLALACSKAARSAATSWPLTVCVCQPKARHLSAKGSRAMVFSLKSSDCIRLRSITAMRLSSLY